MLLGVIANPPNGNRSERMAWQETSDSARHARSVITDAFMNRSVDADTYKSIVKAMNFIIETQEQMTSQLRRGVHKNGRGIKTSDHVQAIIYKHCDDDNYYVHGFGDADLDLKVRGEQLRIDGLVEDTEVQMFAQPDGSVRIVGRNGQRLWEDIEV